MTTLTKVLAFTTFIGVAFCSPLDFFYMALIPYSFIATQRGPWTFCGENNTNAERYEEILKETTDCYGDLFDKNQSMSICRKVENNIQKCSQPLVEFYVDCLPQKSKDLPPALQKVARYLVEAVCTSTGELILEIFNSCFYAIEDKNMRDECKRETFAPKLEKFMTDLPSKAEACQLSEELGVCLQEAVNENCQSIKARKLVTKFYNAAHSACK